MGRGLRENITSIIPAAKNWHHPTSLFLAQASHSEDSSQRLQSASKRQAFCHIGTSNRAVDQQGEDLRQRVEGPLWEGSRS